ncbi:GspH/FimT family pseudopilin [Photobacterium gaetbulicola]|nr:GspH/FimT family pseudopilin [Photobacterium gaetbulicola]
MRKLGSASGFSMIELLVVTSIAVILMLAAAPSFTQLLDTQQLESATNRLAVQFKQARLEAIRRNQVLYIHNLEMSTPTKNSWCVLVTTSAVAPVTCDLTQVISSLQGDAFPRLSISNTKSSVNVDPSRAITGSGMTYSLTSPDMAEGKSVDVKISSKSRVKVCSVGTVTGFEKCGP